MPAAWHLNFSDKFTSWLILGLPALVAKWQTRTLEVRVEKSMGVRVSPSALSSFPRNHLRVVAGFISLQEGAGGKLRLAPGRIEPASGRGRFAKPP